MGATLTRHTLGIVGLSDRARLVLRVMAHHAQDYAHDGHPRGIYHGGWARLSREGLGLPVGDNFRASTYPTEYKAVQRAVAELVAAGWVKPLDYRVRGHLAYELLVS